MKKYPHQQFIEDNAIDVNSLPKMLQKRILGFEELENDLQHTTEHDRTQLVDKLETLSHEIQEDLDEEFEEQLQNNDVEEEETAPIEKEELPEVNDELNSVPPTPVISEGTVIVQDDDQNLREAGNEPVLQSDEAILEEMFSAQRFRILPSQLIRKGFQKSLDKKIVVGRYALSRGKYDNYYQLNRIDN